ncbi:MAG: ribosome silencing factor [Planctomycetota bacterium]
MEIKTITTHRKDIAILCAKIADNKKAEDIKIFAVASTTSIADFFVICSGLNGRQLQSIADDIKQALHERGIHGIGIEGYTDATWILMDYGDVIVHLFDKEKRSFYDLDILWGDAPKIHW